MLINLARHLSERDLGFLLDTACLSIYISRSLHHPGVREHEHNVM